jgi:DNA-binding NtrC family response regulator
MANDNTVLIVDDEPNAVKVLSAILREEGYRVLEASSVDDAIARLRMCDVNAVITDVKMPAKDGFQLFTHVTRHYASLPVLFLTAYGTVESAVNAMQAGAYYYFIKPPDFEKLIEVLGRAIAQNRIRNEFNKPKKNSNEKAAPRIIDRSPAMSSVSRSLRAIGKTESTVLLQGETGTGKEILAAHIHNGSCRRDKPFIAVNCAAIPSELMESELFGYEKGAFTGAVASKPGKFELADGGTMFLDEIGELGLSVQAKLLRVLQEREVDRLGASRRLAVDFRLISSTNRDLKREVEAGRFREDLYYRINVFPILVPPLRERREDISELVQDILGMFSQRANTPYIVDDDVLRLLTLYAWPGNIRQLKNVLERGIVLSQDGAITLNELPPEFFEAAEESPKTGPLKSLKAMELQAVSDALRLYNGNKSKAAKTLGISRKTFYKRLREI